MYYCSYLSRKQKSECGNGEAINDIQSTYDSSDRVKDRDWKFSCTKITDKESNCYWTGYSNDPDSLLHISCLNNYYMTGVESYSIDEAWDRRFKIKCCTAEDVKITQCSGVSNDINELQKSINQHVRDGSVYVGMESKHDNGKE